jgi:hypothetical protein
MLSQPILHKIRLQADEPDEFGLEARLLMMVSAHWPAVLAVDVRTGTDRHGFHSASCHRLRCG